MSVVRKFMKILSFNIWGPPYAKHRAARIRAITECIIQLAPDVVCLQEVYFPRNPNEIVDSLKDIFPHYHLFSSGVIGSGLLTLSRFPIIDAAFHRFRMGGKLFEYGDYYAGKGIGLVRIQMPGGIVDVYNCHPHAQYEPEHDNEYAVYTDTNLYEAVRFINRESNDHPIVLCGDLNTRPDQSGYAIVTGLGCLLDSYFLLHDTYPITFSVDNPYVDSENQCLDYVMVQNAAPLSIELVMTERLSSEALAYSDHYGLLAEIDFSKSSPSKTESDIRPILDALCKRVELALAETENEQITHFERALFGFASLIDGNLLASFISRHFQKLGRLVRILVNIGAVGYGFYEILQAVGNLQARKNVLQALYGEISVQLQAKSHYEYPESG